MLFIDLSNNNREPDFHALKRAGVQGVWLKASEGDWFKDATFSARRAKAQAAGIRVGAYHFARPDKGEPLVEAAWFAHSVGKIGRTDLRPVLDYERQAGGAWGGHDEAWVRSWNRNVKKTLGVGPLFYSYPGLISTLRFKKPVGYGLWVAAYGADDGKEHPVEAPSPWTKYVAHQFTSKGSIAGFGPVDVTRVVSPSAVLAHPLLGRL